MTQRRTLLIAVLVLAAMAAGPGWSLSAPLPAATAETSFRPAGESADDAAAAGVTFTSRRSALALDPMAGPPMAGLMARPLAFVAAPGPSWDHPGAGARALRLAAQRR